MSKIIIVLFSPIIDFFVYATKLINIKGFVPEIVENKFDYEHLTKTTVGAITIAIIFEQTTKLFFPWFDPTLSLSELPLVNELYFTLLLYLMAMYTTLIAKLTVSAKPKFKDDKLFSRTFIIVAFGNSVILPLNKSLDIITQVIVNGNMFKFIGMLVGIVLPFYAIFRVLTHLYDDSTHNIALNIGCLGTILPFTVVIIGIYYFFG